MPACSGPLGRSSRRVASTKSANSRGSSPGRTTISARSPCLTAFTRDAALPVSVRGPVDFWALAWLAASFAAEAGGLSPAVARAAGSDDDGAAGAGAAAAGSDGGVFGATMGELLPTRAGRSKRVGRDVIRYTQTK